MTIILFIIILAVLVLVHEFGHFIVAKKAGMRVDEFGLGLPPRAKTLWKKNGTEYSLNWIPFGGFVKIYGEDFEDAGITQGSLSESFMSKPRKWQAAVLVAGVTMNILFAWLLFSVGYMSGMPVATDDPTQVSNPRLMITGVLPETPAQKADIRAGDEVLAIITPKETIDHEDITVNEFQQAIIGAEEGDIVLNVRRGDAEQRITVTPSVVDGVQGRAIGVSLATVGTMRLLPHEALWQGLKMTVNITIQIAVGLWTLLINAVTGNADLSQITGPVGIAGLVGDATRLGFVYVLTFTAFISLNLAVLNLVPFPALDGGRLLFVLIEAITRKPINQKFFRMVNGVGFALLILLMVVVTFNDVLRLF